MTGLVSFVAILSAVLFVLNPTRSSALSVLVLNAAATGYGWWSLLQ